MYEKETLPQTAPVEILPTEALKSTDPESRILADRYVGLCTYSEPFWLGYLSYIYLDQITSEGSELSAPDIISEVRNKDGVFLGIGVRKRNDLFEDDNIEFGEETDLILWSPHPELVGKIVSNEGEKTVARQLGIFPIDRANVAADSWEFLNDAVNHYDELYNHIVNNPEEISYTEILKDRIIKKVNENNVDLTSEQFVLAFLKEFIKDKYDIEVYAESYAQLIAS